MAAKIHDFSSAFERAPEADTLKEAQIIAARCVSHIEIWE
jgi:hypothetical protein